MKPWLRVRYYCTNVAGGCVLAKADRPFSAAEHVIHGGACPGTDRHPCGAALKAGAPLDLRLRWAALSSAGVLLVALVAWGLHALLFPAPLAHVGFTAPQSTTSDDAGNLDIEVVRSADLERTVQLRYAVVDGSARKGEDYTIEPGQLTFAPGERRKTLAVALVPDPSFMKPRRTFSIVLLNVVGTPRHVVTIGPRPVARSDALVAERSVLAASVVAKDIADLAVRQRILGQLLGGSRGSETEFAAYRRTLGVVDGNLVRARESYLQLLRELRSQQPSTVLAAMDRVATDLQRKTFAQQAQAVRVMRRQFTELLGDAKPDMDRWVDELSRIVPHERDTVRQVDTST